MRIHKKYILLIVLVTAVVIFAGGCSMFERVGDAISPEKKAEALYKQAAIEGSFEYLKECVENGTIDVNEQIPFFEMYYEKVSPLFLAPNPPHPHTEYLLQQGADPNIAFGDRTLLTLQTGEGGIDDTTMGALYIRYGADVNARDREGHTALYYAVRHGRTDYVKLLLENGAIVTQEDIDMLELSVKTFFTEQTTDEQEVSRWFYESSAFYTIPALIYEAAEKQGGEARPADALLQAVLTGDSGAVIEGAEDAGVSDVLSYLAAAYCEQDVIESLVSQGLDVSVMREDGMTLLWMAATTGNIETVQYLVENGASLHYSDYENAEGYSDFHPLISAIQNDNMDIVRYLLENGFEFNMALERGPDIERHDATGAMLIATAVSGNAEYIPLLIAHGYEVDENIGYAGLVYAVLEQQDDVLEAILELGINPNYVDERYVLPYTILELCVCDGSTNAMKILNRYGVDMKNGNTSSLEFAAKYGTYEMVKYMLDEGMPVDACDDWGTDDEDENAIYTAVYRGYFDKVKLLVEYGADINDADYFPLLATAGSSRNILEYLIGLGADVNIMDPSWDRTALMQAAINNNTINIQILLDAGADKTLKNAEGKTAYDYAKENDAKDAMKMLG